MPIYEYECAQCGKQFEAFQRISDKPLKSCQFCQGEVHRLISKTSFSLKGGGWYQDGYSKTAPAPAKKNEKDSSASEGKTTETKAPKKEKPKANKKAS